MAGQTFIYQTSSLCIFLHCSLKVLKYLISSLVWNILHSTITFSMSKPILHVEGLWLSPVCGVSIHVCLRSWELFRSGGSESFESLFFSQFDWQQKTLVKLFSQYSDSWLLGRNTHGVHFSLSLSCFSPFIWFYVLRAWPYGQWECFLSAYTIQCTGQHTPFLCPTRTSCQRLSCVCPVPPRDGLLSLPAGGCLCFWWAGK